MSKPDLRAVPDIADPKTLINECGVSILEQYLELAKNGDVQELLIVAKGADGVVNYGHTPTLSFVERLGMLELMKLGWFNNYMTDSDELDHDSQ